MYVPLTASTIPLLNLPPSRAQYTVLQFLGVQKVHVAIGFSMGGQQAYHWAVIYPDYVEKYAYIIIPPRIQNP